MQGFRRQKTSEVDERSLNKHLRACGSPDAMPQPGPAKVMGRVADLLHEGCRRHRKTVADGAGEL